MNRSFDFIIHVLLGLFLVKEASALGDCKCAPSDPCWPSSDRWRSLNGTLNGRLIQFMPPASVCYSSQSNYNESNCSEVLKQWETFSFHSANPGSVPYIWSNETCLPVYPNGTSISGDRRAAEKGCAVGMLPPYIVNATETKHVQAALEFAKVWNLRVIIKNTGHNGAGRNTGYGSLSIWTHHMKGIKLHKKFQISSCDKRSAERKPQMAATLGAGVQDSELFSILSRLNATAVGGTNMDVGVVGWATGGGHGYMTGKYGMGADNILEVELVTPSGKALTVNECQEPDLFWAIRGGGGGTFGVITSMTVKAYPLPSMIMGGFTFTARNGTSPAAFYQKTAEVHGLLPVMQDKGVHGYYTISGPPYSEALTFSGSLFMWNGSNQTFEDAVRPFRQLLQASDEVTSSVTQLPLYSFSDLLDNLPTIDGVSATTSITASRLISRKVVTENQKGLASALQKIGPRATLSTDGLPNVSLSGTFTISKKAVNNSLNPAWRDTVVHLVFSQAWQHSTPASRARTIVNDITYKGLNVLRQLDPESGAYLNEANPFEPGWQWSFFGPNYGRLHSIKTTYDPTGLLWCRQCVGSEDWFQREDGRLCRVYNPFET